MRPIEKGTLAKLQALLTQAREAEYSAVIDLANAHISTVDVKLDNLSDARKVTMGLVTTISRLEQDGQGG